VSTQALKWWEVILFNLGFPKRPPFGAECFICDTQIALYDLGNGTFICRYHWRTFPPSPEETVELALRKARRLAFSRNG